MSNQKRIQSWTQEKLISYLFLINPNLECYCLFSIDLDLSGTISCCQSNRKNVILIPIWFGISRFNERLIYKRDSRILWQILRNIECKYKYYKTNRLKVIISPRILNWHFKHEFLVFVTQSNILRCYKCFR